MRALFSLILILLLVFVILVGGVLAILYVSFFNQTAAEYPFLNDASEIQSIEYAMFTYGDEGFVPEKVGIVLDPDSFMTELKATDCHTGISIGSFMDLVNGKPIKGVVINYNDGSFDFITPYFCINSQYNPKGVMDLLSTKIYGFDEEKFDLILEKHVYAVEIPEGWDGNIENLPDGGIPDGLIPQN